MKLYKIKKSGIDNKGRGLYATRDIKEGTKIIDYIGKLITKKQTQDSDKYDNNKPIYLFTINKRYDLDGDFSWNTAGLINHSCDNNCDFDGKGLKVWVKAIKDIKKGEEFTSLERFLPGKIYLTKSRFFFTSKMQIVRTEKMFLKICPVK